MRGPALAFAMLSFAVARAAALVGDAPPAEWTIARPAVMVYSSDGRCSGVVLAQDLVLTAAHCVTATTNFKIVGHLATVLYQLADVTDIGAHPEFSTAVWPTPDLALLKLSKPLPTGFAPAFLSARPIAVDDRLIVVGYGVATKGDRQSGGTLRMATLIVTDRSDKLVTLRDASAGAISGCSGDSGAPVFAIRAGVPALVGVVSRGHCRTFTEVIPLAPYRDWMLETARRFGSPLDP